MRRVIDLTVLMNNMKINNDMNNVADKHLTRAITQSTGILAFVLFIFFFFFFGLCFLVLEH